MLADDLRDARFNANFTLKQLAEDSGTSRSALEDYEAGRGVPRFDVSQHLLGILGRTYVALDYPRRWPVRLDDDILKPLLDREPDRQAMVDKAHRDQTLIVEADAIAERLDVSWGQVTSLVSGITVLGDELSVWRVTELSEHVRNILHGMESGHEPRLAVVTPHGLVIANGDLAPALRGIDFLVRATQHGADPAFTRHLTGGFLAHHGYPWLRVPKTLGIAYRRALVACRRHGEGNLMAGILIRSIASAED
ncbi:helix-turn-helix domain-containing protein [Cryobacterium sp. M91]|uniref:helix-turn-helix domain-containing protein n=1 Tax=Cryobacterium sp. M91 TaxID=2048294 RepID=UPI000CE38161|nr:helix-turn-helix transcriptional regulator [Cryobacterium sp. M91]